MVGVPLAFGGELPVPSAALASLGRADYAVSGNRMTINQYTNQAILNWRSFNIGKENTVRFKQPSSQSIALNRIFQEDPSRIFGKLSANGQVYLINQSGFVFGPESRIDVNTLLASTLDITDETFQRGVTKVFDQDGRAALTGTGEIYRKDAQGNYILDAAGNRQKISIRILEGARLSAAAQGRILTAAPQVINRGTLNAPDGQILMVAATDRVYLQEASGDPALRGLIVEVKTGGEVTNAGQILTPRGNTTLMGFAVNQEGLISANTAIAANGSIRLLAREGGTAQQDDEGWLLKPGRTTRERTLNDGLGADATVTLAPGSRTLATPNLKERTKAVDSQVQQASKVEAMGHRIQLQNNALIRSQAGEVTLTATEYPGQPMAEGVKNGSRIDLDAGAVIDVSGVGNVKLPMSRNVVTVELRGNELRDSPLQRGGILYGKKVQVDARKGTPLADITGELERIARTVAERSTTGGAINLNAEGMVTAARNSRLNFSGGSVFYRPGYINTTRLIAADGGTVDIGDADINQRYIGLIGKVEQNSIAWNINTLYERTGPTHGGRFVNGYVEGKSAGSLNIKTAVLDLEAEMQGVAVNGRYQRLPDRQARGGRLSIDLARTPDHNQAVAFSNQPTERTPTLDQPGTLTFDGQALARAGLSSADIQTHARIRLEKDVQMHLPDGASLSLTGGAIDFQGRVTSHGGAVTLATQYLGEKTEDGGITLGGAGRIDVSGNWNNDRPADSSGKGRLNTQPLWTDGGTVSLVAQGDVDDEAGSEIDVDGGAQRTRQGDIEPGAAGSVQLSAERLNGSSLTLQGSLSGFAVAGGRGGTLALTSNRVEIGAGSPDTGDTDGKPLVLDPGLFRSGGFASYRIASNKSGLTVNAGAALKVEVKNRVLAPEAVSQVSGSELKNFSRIELLPELTRPAGQLNLVLAQTAGSGGESAVLSIQTGASVETAPGGRIGLTSDSSILVDGQLRSPSGAIDLQVTPPFGTDPGFLPNQGIWLSGGAKLDAAGATKTYRDGLGRLRGSVLDGGTIGLAADRGFIVTEAGSLLDVSGTAAELDLPTRGANQSIIGKTRLVGSSGGRIRLQSAEGMQLRGALMGRAGAGPGASGGELSLELNPLTRNESGQELPGQLPFPDSSGAIVLSQNPDYEKSPATFAEGVKPDEYGQATLSANQIAEGEFSLFSAKALGSIDFNGGLSLRTDRDLVLDAPVLRFLPGPGDSAGWVALESPHLSLGSTQTRPGAFLPEAGDATLTARAKLLDVRGEAVLRGFAQTSLESTGDLRLSGTWTHRQQRDFLGELLTAGDLTLTARQIYPTTLSEFRVAVQDREGGVLAIRSSAGKASRVLSAAGKLTLEAPNISQGGTLKAPLGQIVLNAGRRLELLEGSLTSNTARGGIIPFGRIQGGLDWIYPLGTQSLIWSQPPEKKMLLSGQNIDMAPGAVLDSRGGGNLAATEWLPGPGGSYDRLDPTSSGYQGSFAVLPGYTSGAAPIDPLLGDGAGLKTGDSLYLSGGSGLKAGHYVLLPAYYALLPGAWLITPQATQESLVPGGSLSRGDGARVVAGYRTVAGTDLRDPYWSGYAVEKGDRAGTRSEYDIQYANRFYTRKARQAETSIPYLPGDGGYLRIIAQTGLRLDGLIQAKGVKTNRGGRLDIAADRLRITDGANPEAADGDAVSLTARSLNALDVASLVLGALRDEHDGKTELNVKAATVELGRNARLSGKDIILAGRDQITLGEGSSLKAEGKAPAADRPPVSIDGDAGLVRVANGAQLELYRTSVTGQSGSIEVAAGAGVSSNGSMMLDATATNRLEGKLDITGGSLALGADRISLGTRNTGVGGLLLGNDLLANLGADELILSSSADIGLYAGARVAAKRLELHTGGLLGFAAGGQGAIIEADQVLIDNRNGAHAGIQATGSGDLDIRVETAILGGGAYRLGGFSRVLFEASRRLATEGTGDVQSAADIEIAAPVIEGGRGANTRVDATGHSIVLSGGSSGATSSAAGLGARLAMTADKLRAATRIDLPSGALKLTAVTGNLNLDSGAFLDVSGREVKLGDTRLETDGGSIALTSEAGRIGLAAGATLKLGGERGGTLEIAAPGGAFEWTGNIDARGAQAGGRFGLDIAATGSVGTLGALGSRLRQAGFTDAIRLNASRGDWNLAAGDSLEARRLSLATGAGSLDVEGTLRAEGSGAAVELRASDRLRLADTARVWVHGTAEQSGRLMLDATTEDGGDSRGIQVDRGAHIDVSSLTGGANGSVELRAPRQGADVAVQGNLGAAIGGAGETTVEAVRTYRTTGTITEHQIASWKSDTDAFMANADAIESRLHLPGGLRPELSVIGSGDLTLAGSGWDLAEWRYGGRPGVLSLAAAGNLAIEGKLSDGFRDNPQGLDLGNGRFVAINEQLQTGASWSYRLLAGQDVRIGNGTLVRTGAGLIEVIAGRDFVLGNAGSALYTLGRPDDTQRYGTLKPGGVAKLLYGEYPVDGGDIRIQAGRDVIGAVTGQFFDGWFTRMGDWKADSEGTGGIPTAWAIAIGGPEGSSEAEFRQNIGALGGGNVTVDAGRDVRDLSIMVPTTGKPVGTPVQSGDEFDYRFQTNQVRMAGGGDIAVSAGNDIVGGTYYTGKGVADLAAKGSIRGSDTSGQAVLLALGDSRFNLEAGDRIELGAAINPTVIGNQRNRNYFFTYSPDSALSARALAGDITLRNDGVGMVDTVNALRPAEDQIPLPGVSAHALSVYPASLDVEALQGTLTIERSLIAYPSAHGALSLLAGGDMTTGKTGDSVFVTLADADSSLLPNIQFPADTWNDAYHRLQPFGDAEYLHAAQPVHALDTSPAVIAANGSLRADDPLIFTLPKSLQAMAGIDIRDVSFNLQHPFFSQTRLRAGRDIRFATPRNDFGNIVNTIAQISLAGPGQLVITAGRDIDLGSMQGIFTTGNITNSALLDLGASISILAGMGEKGAQFEVFAKTYAPESKANGKLLTQFMREITGNPELDRQDALTAYHGLKDEEREVFLLNLLFSKLRESAAKAAMSGASADYKPGYQAIDTMFPGAKARNSSYSGDLKLYYSRISTYAGGDINLLAPGGSVNAGLASAFTGSKSAGELGVVVQGAGSINGLVNRNFIVNQSRIFALDGGDITVWSANGNIDAGRGAKAALSVSPPRVTFDRQGNLKVIYPPSVSGSGIRTASSTSGKPGDVYLAAPRGVVDASDAGIGGNNITIAASAIINAANIDIGGTSSGFSLGVALPQMPPPAAASTAGAVTNAVMQTAEDAVNNDVNQTYEKAGLLEPRYTPLKVDILGFGECSLEAVKTAAPGCG